MKLNYAEQEKNKWDQYYKEALAGKGQEHEHSLWWETSDNDSMLIIKKYIDKEDINILESGCGSGGSSFYLINFFQQITITLCDISSYALRFAKSIEPNSLKGKINYVNSEISAMPFEDNTFDVTWNVGVIEHYPIDNIIRIANEMLRVTKVNGHVIVGIPNRRSIATLKAWTLGTQFGRKFLYWISGYKFDSEILYGNKFLKKTLKEELKKNIFVEFAGNILWVGAPNCWVQKTNVWFPQSSFAFLTFFVIKK